LPAIPDHGVAFARLCITGKFLGKFFSKLMGKFMGKGCEPANAR
jgi:hypothetical protein